MIRLIFSLALLILITLSCTKNQDKSNTQQVAFSGVWVVDSTDITNYIDNVEGSSMRIIEYPSNLKFDDHNHVTWNKSSNSNTTSFNHFERNKALSDLDFNQTIDTVSIIYGVNGTHCKFLWNLYKDSIGNSEYKSVMTLYFSQ